MKKFALLLILSNIGLFAWLQGELPWLPWQPQDVMTAIQPSPKSTKQSELPTLTLVNENNSSTTVKPVAPTHPQTSETTTENKTAQENVSRPTENITKPVENPHPEIASKLAATLAAVTKATDVQPIATQQPIIVPEPALTIQPAITTPKTTSENSLSITTEKSGTPVTDKKEVIEKTVETPNKTESSPTTTALATAQTIVESPKSISTPTIPTVENKTTPEVNNHSTLSKNNVTIINSTVAESPKMPVVAKDVKAFVTTEKTNICFVAGPYHQASSAQGAAKWFRGKSKIHAEVQSDDVPTVYWVYLPAYKNHKEALRQAQHLAQLGIADYVIMTSGRYNNAISLGVYKDEISAKHRADELHKKGYKRARVEKQQQGSKRYWLNVKMPATQKELVTSFKKAQKISAIEVNMCE